MVYNNAKMYKLRKEVLSNLLYDLYINDKNTFVRLIIKLILLLMILEMLYYHNIHRHIISLLSCNLGSFVSPRLHLCIYDI